MSDVLIRLAAPGEYEAIGELGETAYSHGYDITDGYRERVRDVAARATRIVDGHTRPLLAFGYEVGHAAGL
jgi:hypothetical protein